MTTDKDSNNVGKYNDNHSDENDIYRAGFSEEDSDSGGNEPPEADGSSGEETPEGRDSLKKDSGKTPRDFGGRLFRMFGEYLKIIKRSNVWVMGLSLFLLITFVSTWLFLLPLYLKKLGATDQNIGTAYLFFVLAFSILQIPGGYIADRYGRKKIIAYPTFILPIFYIVAAMSNNWIVVMTCLTLGNLIQGIQLPALYSLMAESVDEKERGMGFSILEISLAAGFTVGPLLGNIMLKSSFIKPLIITLFKQDSDPVRLMLFLTGLVLIPCALLRLFGLKDSTSHEDFQVNVKEVIKAFDTKLAFLLISFIFYGLMIDTTFYGPFIPLYAKNVIKMTESSILMMFMWGGFFAIFFNLVSGKIIGMIGSQKGMIVGILGHSLLFIPWLFAPNFKVAVSLYIPTYLFLQLSYIAHDTLMSDLTHIRTRSTIMGVFFMVPGILGALAPEIGARLMTTFGPKAPFIMAIVFAILSVGFLLPVKPERN